MGRKIGSSHALAAAKEHGAHAGVTRNGGPMRIIPVIGQPKGIEKILTHLGLRPSQACSSPVPLAA